mmetsp:Transcript_4051/g.5172  ORF Transcript_4051/g.5172 Transcript_4051/m.5172 type:complete len:157 (+) Transcript_4051:552-1022(+)|eukprot:CAMPEP_0176340060 /NCGR_PEP_ID=MMETSP0126-20121128/1266_1 /TAXON_ID=141414 ORGANISM="Strombidinopsis acuminatum, Strain SPMC142" /NCGR_SAMPLE_ID=MMETSP0126 /ASSEMBLY_ACC=CAM_ASM_000229 /LENGTH=156 /DNA_ID=CAMNT_0017684031 /DNA_START=512 /DNA_END=982 /DNA_ORIENTATION=-
MQADGVISLAPATISGPGLLLDALEDARVIADRTFIYSIDNNETALILGANATTVSNYSKNETQLTESTVDIESLTYWSMPLNGATIGTKTLLVSSESILLDTGSTQMAMPASDLEHIISFLRSQMNTMCTKSKNNLYTCLCTEKMYDNFNSSIKV